MYAWRRVDSSSKRATEVISYVEERAARLAIDNAARRSRCPRTGVGGLRGRAAERLVEPRGLRLFARGLFESGRVSVGGGDGG